MPDRFTALVCESDPLTRAGLRVTAEDAGFNVLEEVGNAVEAIRATELLRPRLVLIAHDLMGLSGADAIPDLRARDPEPEVVLITDDLALRDRVLDEGAFAVAPRRDQAALERILAEVSDYLLTGERRSGGDRRRGGDRRQKQDWTKVTTERRHQADRRQDPRRAADLGEIARAAGQQVADEPEDPTVAG